MSAKENRLGTGSEDAFSNPFTWLGKKPHGKENAEQYEKEKGETGEQVTASESVSTESTQKEDTGKSKQAVPKKHVKKEPLKPDENKPGSTVSGDSAAAPSPDVLQAPPAESEPAREQKNVPARKSNKSKEGLPHGWTRVTWVVRDEHAEIIRALHAWTGDEIKDIVNNIFKSYFSKPKVSAVIEEALAFSRRKKVSLKDLD